jgi:hypothetical protein
MSYRLQTAFCILGLICGSVCLAQSYRCDWSVVGIAGGEMASSEYRCVATAGQTAAGFMAGPDFWALIGYWLPERQSGVQEAAPSQGALKTRLYAPSPNPARSHVAIRYSLAADGPVTLAVHDIAGRVVRQLLASSVRRGAYRAAWNGTDNHGRSVADGVYFLKFTAGDYRQTHKLVVQR